MGSVVVVVVVEPLVGVDGCCGRVVVVVVDVGAVGRGLVETVVVTTCPRLWPLAARYPRCAEATGTEIASTTVTAVNTTMYVRSLRLILYPFFDGWESPRRPRTHSGTRTGAHRETPASPPAEPGARTLGSSRPRGGARTCSNAANSYECDVAAISG